MQCLTVSSGCSLIRNLRRLKHSLRIFAHENELIFFILPWHTKMPEWATARSRGAPSWSYNRKVRHIRHMYSVAQQTINGIPLHYMQPAYEHTCTWKPNISVCLHSVRSFPLIDTLLTGKDDIQLTSPLSIKWLVVLTQAIVTTNSIHNLSLVLKEGWPNWPKLPALSASQPIQDAQLSQRDRQMDSFLIAILHLHSMQWCSTVIIINVHAQLANSNDRITPNITTSTY